VEVTSLVKDKDNDDSVDCVVEHVARKRRHCVAKRPETAGNDSARNRSVATVMKMRRESFIVLWPKILVFVIVLSI
jgi:hypothetical protein